MLREVIDLSLVQPDNFYLDFDSFVNMILKINEHNLNIFGETGENKS